MKHGTAHVRRLGAALLLLGAAGAHSWFEASMARHMLVQLPAIALSGWLMMGTGRHLTKLALIDAHGLTTLAATLMVSAYWMVPRALELSTASLPSEVAKFASVLAMGTLSRAGLQRANGIIQIFFLGNFCAMCAIVGMLYQDQPRQLCNLYTIDDQAIAGIGLVLASCVIPLGWSIVNFTAFLDPGAPPNRRERQFVELPNVLKESS